VDAGSIRLGLRLGPSAESPDIARRAVRAALARQVGAQFVDDAVLCTSEIVTNAVTHTARGCDLQMSFDPASGVVRVEVSDRSPHQRLFPMPVDAKRIGGRGLRIVSQASTRWGTKAVSNGKVVWFELATRAQPPAHSVLPA